MYSRIETSFAMLCESVEINILYWHEQAGVLVLNSIPELGSHSG
jgi:hypothetical protein